MKSATLFSGFDGVGIGMQAAGLSHAWGIEYDDQIASVARLNGFNTHTLNILDADPALFEPVDVLHASPPCPNFSVAKTGAEETPHDIALARKVADFIEVIRPKYFTLENVYAYRNSQSWQIISNRLYACGYWSDTHRVNFANYGVPQTRQRMIVRAVHNGFVPYLPKAKPWQGWYQAIEDLIPTLPPSEFAPWQLARLPEEIKESFIAAHGKYEDKLPISKQNYPALTVTANTNQTSIRAFIANAWMINSENAGQEWGGTRYGDEPSMTISTGSKPKAFIVDDRNGSFNDERQIRAWLSHGRVVKMPPRALARFQSFPDWYRLPDKPTLACKGIGNAVPPKGMEKIYRTLIG